MKSVISAMLIALLLSLMTAILMHFDTSFEWNAIVFLGYWVAVFCLRLKNSQSESFLRWRLRWSAKISIILGFVFAFFLSLAEAIKELREYHFSITKFFDCWFGCTIFVCVIGFVSGCLLILFVPLFFMSGSTSIRVVWESANRTP